MTGSNTGLGKEIAQLLYSKNARVFMMARSKDKTLEAMDAIKKSNPDSKGELYFIRLDLSDLSSVKESVQQLLHQETRVDLLFNNAGVGFPEKGLTTAQGYELQLGVNCLGHFALTKLLTPLMASTATKSPRGSVRVVWVSSSAAESFDPKLFLENLKSKSKHESLGALDKYGFSKLGNYLHGAECASTLR